MSWWRKRNCQQRAEKAQEFRSSQFTDQLQQILEQKLQTAEGRRTCAKYAASYVRDRYVHNYSDGDIMDKDPMLKKVWRILDAIAKEGC